jgi:hypothetical protein
MTSDAMIPAPIEESDRLAVMSRAGPLGMTGGAGSGLVKPADAAIRHARNTKGAGGWAALFAPAACACACRTRPSA